MIHPLRLAPPIALVTLALLPACALLDRDPAPKQAAALPPTVQRLPGIAAAQTADQLDRTTEAERAAALSVAPTGGAALGTVRVSLGSPAEQGFWLKSSLVDAARPGRVSVEGQSVAVELRPGTGAAQLSLAAFRALGLPLTGLPEVTVTAE